MEHGLLHHLKSSIKPPRQLIFFQAHLRLGGGGCLAGQRQQAGGSIQWQPAIADDHGYTRKILYSVGS